MTGTVHSLLGAAVGSLCGRRLNAFVSGVFSHIIADSIPHRDIDPRIDVPATAVLLYEIAEKYGSDSPEFWGAVGGVIPDIEHAASLCGCDKKYFHTHVDDGKHHGRLTKTLLSQFITGGAAIAVLLLKQTKR